MEALKKALVCVVCSGLFVAGIPLPVAGQQALPEQNVSSLPDSPGTTLKQQSIQLAWGAMPSPSQSTPSQGTQAQPQPPLQKPVGTAVAEAPPSSGIAASQPAGVAIAPAKQRRVRTIVLRMGAIVGAGVAVGSVVALTAATSSKPPGAH